MTSSIRSLLLLAMTFVVVASCATAREEEPSVEERRRRRRPVVVAPALPETYENRDPVVEKPQATPTSPEAAQQFADPQARMRVHLLDVGQGSALLVEFPCAAMLIDTGGEENALFDSTDALTTALDKFFVARPDLNRTIDLLLITHPHIDHVRGIPAVLERYTVRNVVDNGDNGDDIVKKEMAALRRFTHGEDGPKAQYRSVDLEEITLGSALTDDVIDPIRCEGIDPRIRVFWGGLDADPGWGENRYGHRHFENANNHSVVVKIDFGLSSVLVTGDLEETGIHALLARIQDPTLLDADVYVVGHHGSFNGTTRTLLDRITPDIALISMGSSAREVEWSAWRYGHPRRDVIELLLEKVARRRPPVDVDVARASKRFEKTRIEKAIYATGWDGTVVVNMSANGGVLVEERPAAPNE